MAHELRKKERAMDFSLALELLRKGDYGVLSLADKEGPYAVPISYALWEQDLYFHCALEGRKMDMIPATGAPAQFTVVAKAETISEKFSVRYQSVMAFGTVAPVTDKEEKIQALRLLCQKYSPGYEREAEKSIQSSVGHTGILKLHWDDITGKESRGDE